MSVLYKEIIFSIVIVVVVVVGNVVTQNYTHKSVKNTTTELEELKQELLSESNEDIDWDNAKEKFSVLQTEWRNSFEKLAYYIEHDELEKIETNLAGLNGYLDKEEYGDSMAQLDISVYVLEHIKNKTILSLINIF